MGEKYAYATTHQPHYKSTPPFLQNPTILSKKKHNSQAKNMADKTVEAILKEVDHKMAQLDVKIACMQETINMLQANLADPPNKEEIERRLERAIEEFNDLTAHRHVQVEKKQQAIISAHFGGNREAAP
jgi:glyceraldehyde-3-phosphate dehydrogenase/erythrose-4-phosphate dehydrogenase